MTLPAFLQQRQRHFRNERMRAFLETHRVTNETRILDVGGAAETWNGLGVQPRVTLLNMPRAKEAYSDRFAHIGGDACWLPFPDRSFDIVFSNSVIEHVGSFERQQQFAREVQRVGREYWIQTPNRFFPLETHFLTPLVHLLPRTWQRGILERFSIWEWLTQPQPDQKKYFVEHFLNEVHLLGPREMSALFPHARLRKERWLGWTKSLIASS